MATNAYNIGSFTVASQAEAEAGTNNTNGMTPLRVAQAIAALAPDEIYTAGGWTPNLKSGNSTAHGTHSYEGGVNTGSYIQIGPAVLFAFVLSVTDYDDAHNGWLAVTLPVTSTSNTTAPGLVGEFSGIDFSAFSPGANDEIIGKVFSRYSVNSTNEATFIPYLSAADGSGLTGTNAATAGLVDTSSFKISGSGIYFVN